MRPRGRFIADAVCPKCGINDRIQMDVATGLRRWCVACDFDETLADASRDEANASESNEVQLLDLQPLAPAKETK